MKENVQFQLRSSLHSWLFLGLLIGLIGPFLFEPSLVAMSCSVSLAHASPMEIRHSVGAGEDLHLLAAYYYRDARQWKRIYQANRNQIRNPNLISLKQVLRIEVPDDWKALMPFSAWMERLKEPPSLEEAPSPTIEESPAEKSEQKESSGDK